MNSSERMAAAINLKPVDRIPNAPFYEAPICNYFGPTFHSALMGGQAMADTHLKALDAFSFDWVMVGMGLIGGITPEALGCAVNFPEDVFPVIEKPSVQSFGDIDAISNMPVQTKRLDHFLDGVSRLSNALAGEVPIACEFISPFTIAARLRGPNDIMVDMGENPEFVVELQRAVVPHAVELGRLLIDAGVEYIFYGADMECPLLISPLHYEKIVHDPTKAVVNALAGMGGRVLPHMCGNIVKMGIVDLLIDMNISGIMPGNLTQETVLDLRTLKEKVGDRTAVFDNLNPNTSLLIGSPEETRTETLAHLNRAKHMRGYLFSTAGTTSPVTPRENFEAMNDAVINSNPPVSPFTKGGIET